MSRWSVLLAGASLLAFSAAAQAGTVRVTIAEYSKGTGPYFNDAAKAFEAANPGTKIQIEVVPWDNLQQKLTTDISAGANADLSIIGTRWLLDYVSQGIVDAARQIRDAGDQGPLHRHLPPALGDERQDLRPADRGLGPRHVLQQGRVQEGGLRHGAGHLGRLPDRGRQDQGRRRRRVPLRPSGQGDRDRRLLLLRAVVATAATSSRTRSRASTCRPPSMPPSSTRA